MPVTINIADHAAEHWRKSKASSQEDLLKLSCSIGPRKSKRVIQSSFSAAAFDESHISSSNNGFVHAAFQAYSSHHHLTIRPDDVWFAILSQLNFYINAHAEELRDHFVAHEGQKALVIRDIGTIETLDFGLFARRMTGLIQENVKDPNFRDWIMPTFSTTTVSDRTTAAVLMMGSMQAYFTFTSMMTCGIPTATLLGNREDWQDILERLDKLSELGCEPRDFAILLRPVLRNFIATFDDPHNASTLDFWTKIAHHTGGSGMSILSGWLTAFCFWRNDGHSLYHQNERGIKAVENSITKSRPMKTSWVPGCHLDGVTYHVVDTHDIPNGFASVPVTVDGKETRARTVASFTLTSNSR
jgi:hypothetical protein